MFPQTPKKGSFHVFWYLKWGFGTSIPWEVSHIKIYVIAL